ncbi:MAG: cyclic nucleotide-binding domain-containing protein, partial [Thermoanaerobaculia bacterium]
MSGSTPAGGKTELRRLEQYRDRWSSYDELSGLVDISERLTVDQLREFELFADYDDKFLAKIASDVSLASWKPGSVLFEQGAYIDLAFCVVEGEVEVILEGVGGGDGGPRPIFDLSRTVIGEVPPEAATGATVLMRRASRPNPSEITFLSTMDFDLPVGAAVRLGPGELFGEIGAMSGWPQSVTARTVSPCRLLQIRLPALRLMKRKSRALKERIDELYRERSLTAQLRGTPLFRGLADPLIEALKESVELVSCDPDEVLVREGEPADALYLVRSGFIKLMQQFGEGEI